MKRALILLLVPLFLVACRAPLSDRLDSHAGRVGELPPRLDYRVYLPPGYADSGRTYPVLVWFHGGGENEDGWGRVGRLGEYVHDRMAAGELEPFIVVAPSAGIFTPVWLAYERRLVNELLPQVHTRYRTNRVNLAFGHSMGGLSALMVTLRNPDLFDAVCVASPFLFDTSPWDDAERRAWFRDELGETRFTSRYRYQAEWQFDTAERFAQWNPFDLLRNGSPELPPILLTSGDQDQLGLWPHNLHLHEVLKQRDVRHEWLVQEGVGHGTIEDPRLMRWLASQAVSAVLRGP